MKNVIDKNFYLFFPLLSPWKFLHQFQHHHELALHQGVVLVLHVRQGEFKLLLDKILCLWSHTC